MRLAPVRWSVALALAVSASHLMFGQIPSPASAIECKQKVRVKDFDVRPDGPYLWKIGYSKVLHTCVVVVVQTLPAAHLGFEAFTEIGDAVQRKCIWSNWRDISKPDRALENYPTFEDQLRKLEITLVSR